MGGTWKSGRDVEEWEGRGRVGGTWKSGRDVEDGGDVGERREGFIILQAEGREYNG